jgi:hypothetical protein
MARAVSNIKETPKFTLLTEYAVQRLGAFPSVKLTFEECVYILEPPVEVTATGDEDEDGLVDTLTVPAWVGREDLLGRTIALADSTTVGVIAEVEQTEDALIVNLVDGFDGELGTEVSLVVPTPGFNSPAYRRSDGGRVRVVCMPGNTMEALTKLMTILARVHVAAVRSVLIALEDTTITDMQILGALQALSAQGITLDGILAAEGELLDEEAAELPYVVIMGDQF